MHVIRNKEYNVNVYVYTLVAACQSALVLVCLCEDRLHLASVYGRSIPHTVVLHARRKSPEQAQTLHPSKYVKQPAGHLVIGECTHNIKSQQ